MKKYQGGWMSFIFDSQTPGTRPRPGIMSLFFYYVWFLLVLCSCSPPVPEYPVFVKTPKPGTWNSWVAASREIDFSGAHLPSCGRSPGIKADTGVIQDMTARCLYAKIRAGIASHHSFVGPLLMAYYRELARQSPGITTFFILGPDHFRATHERIAVGTEPYIWGRKKVEINKKAAASLMDRLSLTPDPHPFKLEHSILTHIPFIAAFFPGATIVPVIIDYDCPRLLFSETSAFICEYMERDTFAFVLVSIDFSHHLTREETAYRDACSVSILREMNSSYTREITCDSPGAWFILTNICASQSPCMEILYYTTNEDFCGSPVEDITSYFFTLVKIP